MTKSVFDEFARSYDQWFEKEGYLIYQMELKALENVMIETPSPKVEIGVGTGRFAEKLDVSIGIDPSLPMLKIAKKRVKYLVCGYGESIPLKTGSSGTCILVTALCFLKSPQKTISEIKRVLKKDGALVIGMIQKNSPWGRYYLKRGKEGHPIYSKANFMNPDEVIELAKREGFDLELAYSTLFQRPGHVEYMEEPIKGFAKEAGFVALKFRR